MITAIATFVEEKFKNELKEDVLKVDAIQIGVKLFITDVLKSKGL